MNRIGYLFGLLLCLGAVACSRPATEVRQISRDPEVPGIVQVEISDSHPDRDRVFEITPAAGILREFVHYRDTATQQIVSFSTGALDGCRNRVSAESSDKMYLAVCTQKHTADGLITDRIDIVARGSVTDTPVWSRTFDWGWRISGFAWNAESPVLAIVAGASVSEPGFLAWVAGLTGHGTETETVHLLFISVPTKPQRDYIVAEHTYGIQRLLRWDNQPK